MVFNTTGSADRVTVLHGHSMPSKTGFREMYIFYKIGGDNATYKDIIGLLDISDRCIVDDMVQDVEENNRDRY
jgi:hypothetical protein